MRVVIADFETFSACDLKKAGAWRYAEDISTNIICLAFQVGQEPVQLWHPGADGRALADLVAADDVMWVAHNVQFERAIWKRIMTPVHGFAPIPDDRWHDTMAVCAYKALPLSLDRVSMALRLPTQKDKEGSRLTISLSRTNKAGNYEHTPEKLQRVYDYCKTDIAGEAELHKRIGWLPREEREVWKLDQKINERGVCLDMEFVNAAQQVCDDATRPLLQEFRALTGIDKLRSPMLKEWLVKQGCPFPRDSEGEPDTSLDKEHIAKLLGVQDDEEDSLAGDEDDYEESNPQSALPYSYRRPLEILRVIGSASIKKLAAMQACVCADGQARGLLQYHGAGPGRWAGRLLQPQNFPRPTLKQVVGWKENGEEIIGGHDADALVDAVKTGDAEYVRTLFGEPIEAVASGLRHALVARPGYTFEVGDFAKIECVIVLAMAGAADTAAKVIKAGSAVYTDMAAKVFRRPVKKTDLKEYTIGKNIVLGCFGAATLVLTNRGAIRLDNIRTEDMVWDGIEWVKHDGLLSQGLRETISLNGVDVTPEHEVLAGSKWHPAQLLAHDANVLSLALGTASANLPSDLTKWGRGAASRMSMWFAPAVLARIKSRAATFAARNLRAATGAQKQNLLKPEKSGGDIRQSARMTRIASAFLTEYLQFTPGVKSPQTETILATAGAGSEYGPGGEKAGLSFCSIFSRWMGGTERNWSWIGEIMTGAMSLGISVLSAVRQMCRTVEQFSPYSAGYKNLKPVFDLANAGPRNRFTILTSGGPLIVHNCGFQMGWKKFRSRYAQDQPVEFCKGAIDEYRINFAPEVPLMWKGLERAAVTCVWERRATEAYGITYQLEDGWLTARLPSGRKLHYYDPKPVRKAMPWDENDIRRSFEYSAWKMGQWKRINAYGGLLTENVVQATARDLLVHGMWNCERERHPLVLTVHDEAITEVESGRADAKLLEQYMTDIPQWAKALRIPVAAETWIGGRYRK